MSKTVEKDELTCLFQPYFFMFCLLGIDTQPSLGKWTVKQMQTVNFDACFNKFVPKETNLLNHHIWNNKKPNHKQVNTGVTQVKTRILQNPNFVLWTSHAVLGVLYFILRLVFVADKTSTLIG